MDIIKAIAALAALLLTSIAQAAMWQPIATEGERFTTRQIIRYGVGDKWVDKIVSGEGRCTNEFFGRDPAYGFQKKCEAMDLEVRPPIKPGGLVREFGQWEEVANEGDLMMFAEQTTVRFHSQGRYSAERQFSAGQTATCDVATFGRLTSWWHTCQKKTGVVTVQELEPQTTGMPYVDQRLNMPTSIGRPGRRITSGPMPQANHDPAFRLTCPSSAKMAPDDPIVYPGQPGRAHHHTFFGNVTANAGSSNASLVSQGNTTCLGGSANRSAYWIPSVIDTRFGRPIPITAAMVYYKQAYYLPVGSLAPPPAGLRMISGDMHRIDPPPAYDYTFEYSCRRPEPPQGDGGFYNDRVRSLPACNAGDTMFLMLHFPQCWDGRNLDSADHKGHMANAQLGGCPVTHPIGLPRISYVVQWLVSPGDDTRRWRLSSDHYDWSKPGGYSMHGDWMNGWEQGVLQQIVRECLNAGRECGSSLIGLGQQVY